MLGVSLGLALRDRWTLHCRVSFHFDEHDVDLALMSSFCLLDRVGTGLRARRRSVISSIVRRRSIVCDCRARPRPRSRPAAARCRAPRRSRPTRSSSARRLSNPELAASASRRGLDVGDRRRLLLWNGVLRLQVPLRAIKVLPRAAGASLRAAVRPAGELTTDSARFPLPVLRTRTPSILREPTLVCREK